MMIHTPWRPELGAPRAQMEIGEELAASGDHVEKFSYEDAFPESGTGWSARGPRWLRTIGRYTASNRSFASRARRFVRANGHRFDVIDANQTDLPFRKSDLPFSGLLVARSVGLVSAYAAFERRAARRWPEPISLRSLAHSALTWPGVRRRQRDARRSLVYADLVNVSNRDDLETVRTDPGIPTEVVHFPLGISARRLAHLGDAAAGAECRLAARTVVFIGTWNRRKGSRDWPRIMAAVLRELPETRFLFLGTGLHRRAVFRDIPDDLRPSAEVVPAFDSETLPERLSQVTAGAFPGYLEGFGISVLEKLAAGLPTVTYDAPGPRDTMGHLARPSTVPAGDTEGFAQALLEILRLSPQRYVERSQDAHRAAGRFEWSIIARETRATYLRHLERVEATSKGAP